MGGTETWGKGSHLSKQHQQLRLLHPVWHWPAMKDFPAATNLLFHLSPYTDLCTNTHTEFGGPFLQVSPCFPPSPLSCGTAALTPVLGDPQLLFQGGRGRGCSSLGSSSLRPKLALKHLGIPVHLTSSTGSTFTSPGAQTLRECELLTLRECELLPPRWRTAVVAPCHPAGANNPSRILSGVLLIHRENCW